MNLTVNLVPSGDFIGHFLEISPPPTLSSPVQKLSAWEMEDGTLQWAPKIRDAVGGGSKEIGRKLTLKFDVEFDRDKIPRMLVPKRFESYIRNHPNFRLPVKS